MMRIDIRVAWISALLLLSLATAFTDATLTPCPGSFVPGTVVNYRSYACYTANFTIKFNSTYGGATTNTIAFPVGFAYINTSKFTNDSATLLTLTGYDSNGNYLGYVQFYPYLSGLIASHHIFNTGTKQDGYLNNENWTRLVVWYNSIVKSPIAAPGYSNVTRYSLENITVLNDSFHNIFTMTLYDVQLASSSYGYLYPAVPGSLASYRLANFNIKPTRSGYPYLIRGNGWLLYLNVSLFYTPNLGGLVGYESKLEKYADNQTRLTAYGTFGTANVTSYSNNVLWYMKDSPQPFGIPSLAKSGNSFDMLSNYSVMFANTTIRNRTNTWVSQGVVNFSTVTWHLSAFDPNTPISVFNPFISVVALPAYTENTVYTTNTVASPKTPSNITNPDTGFGWFKDYDWRRNVTVGSWAFSFNTNAYVANSTHTSTRGSVTALQIPNSAYLLLRMPYEAEFGTSPTQCDGSQLFFANATLGSIPFGIVNSSCSSIAVILSNTTNDSFVYNQFTMFAGSRSGLNGFSNSLIASAWEKGYSSPFNGIIGKNNSIVQFSGGMSKSSGVWLGESTSSGWGYYANTRVNGSVNGNVYISSSGQDEFAVILKANAYANQNMQYLLIPKTWTIAGQSSYASSYLHDSNCYGSVNTPCMIVGNAMTTSFLYAGDAGISDGGVTTVIALNLSSPAVALVTRLYSANVVYANWTAYTGNGIGPCQIDCSAPSLANQSLPKTNQSPIGSYVANTLWQKNSSVILSSTGLGKSVAFNGLALPLAVIVIVVIFTVIIVFSVMADNHIAIVVMLAVAWVLGFVGTVGTGGYATLDFIYVAIMMSIIVGMYEYLHIKHVV